jgi:hypothetical protein
MSSRIIRPFVRYERQLRWLLRRLTPGQYLGLHFTVGLLVAGAFLWFFVDVAEDVVTEDPLVRFDQAVATLLRYVATPTLTTFFLIVTTAAYAEMLTVVGVLVNVSYALRRRWLHVGTWLAALAGGAVLNQLLKALFSRPRPLFCRSVADGERLQLP